MSDDNTQSGCANKEHQTNYCANSHSDNTYFRWANLKLKAMNAHVAMKPSADNTEITTVADLGRKRTLRL